MLPGVVASIALSSFGIVWKRPLFLIMGGVLYAPFCWYLNTQIWIIRVISAASDGSRRFGCSLQQGSGGMGAAGAADHSLVG